MSGKYLKKSALYGFSHHKKMERNMKNIEELNKSRLPIVKINKKLNIYDDMPLFQSKVEEATATLQRVGVPSLMATNPSFSEEINPIQHTIQMIERYNKHINQAILDNAPTSIIKAKQQTKMQYVQALIDLLAEMDVPLQLKA